MVLLPIWRFLFVRRSDYCWSCICRSWNRRLKFTKDTLKKQTTTVNLPLSHEKGPHPSPDSYTSNDWRYSPSSTSVTRSVRIPQSRTGSRNVCEVRVVRTRFTYVFTYSLVQPPWSTFSLPFSYHCPTSGTQYFQTRFTPETEPSRRTIDSCKRRNCVSRTLSCWTTTGDPNRRRSRVEKNRHESISKYFE